MRDDLSEFFIRPPGTPKSALFKGRRGRRLRRAMRRNARSQRRWIWTERARLLGEVGVLLAVLVTGLTLLLLLNPQ